MMSIALGVFAAAMLFASVRHVLAFLRRERVLRDMYAALDVAGRQPGSAKWNTSKADEEGEATGEHPMTRGVFIGRPPELRHDPDAGNSGGHPVSRAAV